MHVHLPCMITIGCFVCAMESGVHIYNVEPLAEKGRIGELSRINFTSGIRNTCSCNTITAGVKSSSRYTCMAQSISHRFRVLTVYNNIIIVNYIYSDG